MNFSVLVVFYTFKCAIFITSLLVSSAVHEESPEWCANKLLSYPLAEDLIFVEDGKTSVDVIAVITSPIRWAGRITLTILTSNRARWMISGIEKRIIVLDLDDLDHLSQPFTYHLDCSNPEFTACHLKRDLLSPAPAPYPKNLRCLVNLDYLHRCHSDLNARVFSATMSIAF
jgi:hypothetical protein